MTTRLTAPATWKPALAGALSIVLCPLAMGQINGTVDHLVKFDSPTTGIDSRVFDNGYNVGIGTTSPQDFLHLYRGNPIRSTVGVLMGNSTTGPGRRGFLVDYHGMGGAELWNFENTNMWFGTNNARRMTIVNNGDVRMDNGTFHLDASTNRIGIGTSVPRDVLHLFSGTPSSVGVLMGNSLVPSGRRGFLVDFHGNGGAELWNFENSDMWFGTNNLRRMTISNDGRVGIGGGPIRTNYQDNTTLAPLLDVQGDVRIQSVPVWNGPNDHDLTWARGFSDGVAYNPDKRLVSREGSSRRYKTDIRPMDEDFAKILTVEPKRYKMRKGYGPPNAWSYGYVAEDLDEAGLRNLVIYDEQGRPDGVAYKKVALYVNEVVRDQQVMIEELCAEMAALRELVHRPDRGISCVCDGGHQLGDGSEITR